MPFCACVISDDSRLSLKNVCVATIGCLGYSDSLILDVVIFSFFIVMSVARCSISHDVVIGRYSKRSKHWPERGRMVVSSTGLKHFS